jgi:hypothetical protein
MLKLWFVAVLLAFASVSCAPGAFGPGSRSNPIRVNGVKPVAVSQNAEVNLITSGPIRSVTRAQADDALDPLVSSTNPVKGGKASTEVSWFRVGGVSAPAGIEVVLVKQTATREVGEVGARTYRIFDSVDLVFSVRVAAGVPVGNYPVVVRIINFQEPSLTGSVALPLEVTPPAK